MFRAFKIFIFVGYNQTQFFFWTFVFVVNFTIVIQCLAVFLLFCKKKKKNKFNSLPEIGSSYGLVCIMNKKIKLYKYT